MIYQTTVSFYDCVRDAKRPIAVAYDYTPPRPGRGPSLAASGRPGEGSRAHVLEAWDDDGPVYLLADERETVEQLVLEQHED